VLPTLAIVCKDFLYLSFSPGAKQQQDLNPLSLHQQWNSALSNSNNHLNANIYSYSETSGGKSYNLYLYVAHFFNTSVNKKSAAA